MRVWTIAGLLWTIVACASAPPRHDTADLGDGGLSAADQQTLAELEAALEDHATWGHPPSWPGIAESGGIHGAWVQIWLTDEALTTMTEGAGAALPVGSVAVKQGYDDAQGDTLRNLTAMYKLADDDWFYASWGPDHALIEAGRPDLCTGCHLAGQDNILAETW